MARYRPGPWVRLWATGPLRPALQPWTSSPFPPLSAGTPALENQRFPNENQRFPNENQRFPNGNQRSPNDNPRLARQARIIDSIITGIITSICERPFLLKHSTRGLPAPCGATYGLGRSAGEHRPARGIGISRPLRCTEMEQGNDEHVQRVREILAANGGALDWGRLTNVASTAGIKLPALRKLKNLPGFSGGGNKSPRCKPIPGMCFDWFLGLPILRNGFSGSQYPGQHFCLRWFFEFLLPRKALRLGFVWNRRPTIFSSLSRKRPVLVRQQPVVSQTIRT